MPLIGYARVSTDEQSTASQAEELRAAGCSTVREEHGSGGSRDRPVLNRLVRDIAPGDTLVVVRLDRLARSLSHLLEVIEHLDERGAFFRSLRDPVDTSSPQGKFTLQVLGAAAELERSLIRDRTRAGLGSSAGGAHRRQSRSPIEGSRSVAKTQDRPKRGLLRPAGGQRAGLGAGSPPLAPADALGGRRPDHQHPPAARCQALDKRDG